MNIIIYINEILEQVKQPIDSNNLIIINNKLLQLYYLIESIAQEENLNIEWDNRLERQYGENHNDPYILLKLTIAYINDMKDIFNQYRDVLQDDISAKTDMLRHIKRKINLAQSSLFEYQNK